ncbi:hypothetical protein FIBSPDRAFT_536715 [Athelia psychrophila]|uniref:Uncharacterized protein n=1 Tax=Athelia psychrophila TaxID=1759441 RepID=A0A166J6N0_9AGAM|nr:hypothetical protein FIBSPDRAFT_536715 [Fibularhizoctonia sp. CBS 109695]
MNQSYSLCFQYSYEPPMLVDTYIMPPQVIIAHAIQTYLPSNRHLQEPDNVSQHMSPTTPSPFGLGRTRPQVSLTHPGCTMAATF